MTPTFGFLPVAFRQSRTPSTVLWVQDLDGSSFHIDWMFHANIEMVDSYVCYILKLLFGLLIWMSVVEVGLRIVPGFAMSKCLP
jgi:hypothetical protein